MSMDPKSEARPHQQSRPEDERTWGELRHDCSALTRHVMATTMRKVEAFFRDFANRVEPERHDSSPANPTPFREGLISHEEATRRAALVVEADKQGWSLNFVSRACCKGRPEEAREFLSLDGPAGQELLARWSTCVQVRRDVSTALAALVPDHTEDDQKEFYYRLKVAPDKEWSITLSRSGVGQDPWVLLALGVAPLDPKDPKFPGKSNVVELTSSNELGRKLLEPAPHELPTFEGWTVDFRLQEFRRMIPDQASDFVPFDSPAGEELFERWVAVQDKQSDRKS